MLILKYFKEPLKLRVVTSVLQCAEIFKIIHFHLLYDTNTVVFTKKLITAMSILI